MFLPVDPSIRIRQGITTVHLLVCIQQDINYAHQTLSILLFGHFGSGICTTYFVASPRLEEVARPEGD